MENTRQADAYKFDLQNIGSYKNLKGQARDLQESINDVKCVKVKNENGIDYLEYNHNNFHMWNKKKI